MFRGCFGDVSGRSRRCFGDILGRPARPQHVLFSCRPPVPVPFPFRPPARPFPFRPFLPVPPARSRSSKRNRRKQSETERTLFGVWGGVLHACSQLLPVFLQACNVMLEHSNIGRRGIKQMELNETKWNKMNAVSCMLPVASILASSMQYNASCFPVHTLGRSNGVRPPCGMQLTVIFGQGGVIVSVLFSACF